jgi:hypothetical protein
MGSLDLVPILLAGATALAKFVVDAYRSYKKEQQTERKVERIERKAEEEPEKIRFAWDLARTKLEAYFDRNLSQVKSIFWVSIFVMTIGFGFVAYGIMRSIDDPTKLTATYVASTAGVITEFIGVTFMLIYRSTLQQAANFVTVLEKINSVGMAVQILDSISDQHDALKNETRAEIVRMLLSSSPQSPITPKTTKQRAPNVSPASNTAD